VSHWFLDLVVHRPDLPLLPGSSARYGWDLWDSWPATLAVELGLFAAGIAVYTSSTVARDRTGTWAWWGLVAFLLVLYAMSALGPPPPGVGVVAGVTESMWLLVALGLVDRPPPSASE
jgi:hypothetical protein